MDIFKLYRNFWDWSFENPELIKPHHVALYAFAIENCNRLGWKKNFGFPTTMAMDAIGIKSYSVYKKTLTQLVEFGFIEMVEYSKNQYSSNIIALKENCKAHNKALDKAMIKHEAKQSESTGQSIDSIDIPLTINNKPLTTNNACEDSNQVKEFVKEIHEKFNLNFSEMSKTHRDITGFVRLNEHQFDYLKSQHLYYHKFKEETNEKKHSIKNYILTWNEYDWQKRYEAVKKNGSSKNKKGFNTGNFDVEGLNHYIESKRKTN